MNDMGQKSDEVVHPLLSLKNYTNKRIVIINGSGGCGKDSFVEKCGKYYKVKNVSSIDPIKKIAMESFGWNGVKDEPSRRFLSNLKNAAEEYCNFTTKYIQKEILNFLKDSNNILFIHIREPELIEKIVSWCPMIFSVLVINNSIPIIQSNASDRNVDEYMYDIYIENNDGLDVLEESAETFCKWIFSKSETPRQEMQQRMVIDEYF